MRYEFQPTLVASPNHCGSHSLVDWFRGSRLLRTKVTPITPVSKSRILDLETSQLLYDMLLVLYFVV
jgi:hypothetical protein